MNNAEEINKKGLGDKIEEVIKTISPKFAEKKKNCKRCKKKKEWLNNNINATFS